MSAGPSASIRVVSGGAGCFGPVGKLFAGMSTWRTKLSQVSGEHDCSVGNQ